MKFSSVLMASAVFITAITLSNTSLAKNGKVYTWTDSKGVVHYGEHPPKDVQAKLIKTRTGHSDPVPAAETPPPARTPLQTQQSNEQNSFKDPERCAKARQNLEILNSGAPVRTRNEKGESVIMGETEKNEQKNVSQLVINQAC